ncbi:MAG: hypothetical protein AAF750_10360 [Planctomycetota bacterium]
MGVEASGQSCGAFCRGCRYPLMGLVPLDDSGAKTSGSCPECGERFDLADRGTFVSSPAGEGEVPYPRGRSVVNGLALALPVVLGVCYGITAVGLGIGVGGEGSGRYQSAAGFVLSAACLGSFFLVVGQPLLAMSTMPWPAWYSGVRRWSLYVRLGLFGLPYGVVAWAACCRLCGS